MKQHPGSRYSQFKAIDEPALKPLPTQPYIFTHVKKVRVHIDDHVEVDRHYYSVPYTLVKQQLEAHTCGQQVVIYHQSKTVAIHPRSYQIGSHTTQPEHMPKSHQAQQDWTPERFERWAKQIGADTEQLVQQYLSQRKHPQQAYRRCMGLLSLEKKFTAKRLNAACARALATGAQTYRAINSMLEKGLDQQPLPTQQNDLLKHIDHQNIRVQHYYH